MVWTAPEVDRVDEPFVGSERVILQGFLDFGRRTLMVKCAGLTGAQLATRAVALSTLSLLGLVRHVTDVERTWFRCRFGGRHAASRYTRPDRPDAAFDDLDPDQAAANLADLALEWEAADAAVAGLELDHIYVSDRWGPMSLRWAYSHLISEYNRHNGHADLLREHLDGTTGT